MNTILKQRIITASIAAIFVIATLFLLEPLLELELPNVVSLKTNSF